MACRCGGGNALPARRPSNPWGALTPGGCAPSASQSRCPPALQSLADNRALQLLSLLFGGALPIGRILVAYCASGALDRNMRRAAGDAATYLGVEATICGIAAPFLVPVAGVGVALGGIAALLGLEASILAALAKGQPPSIGDVTLFLQQAGPVVAAFSGNGGGGFDMSRVADAAGALQAAHDAAVSTGIAKNLSLPSIPPGCDTDAATSTRALARANALAVAKAKARHKTAATIALACAKEKARSRTTGQPPDARVTVDGLVIDTSKCDGRIGAPPAPSSLPAAAPAKRSGGGKAALAAAAAAVAAKLLGVLG